MSTNHSADMTPGDSSEQLSVGEVAQQALAARIFSVVRKPMSTPKYAALLVVLALVFGLGSWGIIRGIQNITSANNAATSNKNAGVQTQKHNFFTLDDYGNMRAVEDIEYGEEEKIITLPSAVLDNDYVLTVTGQSHSHCSLSLDVNDMDNGSIFGETIKFDTQKSSEDESFVGTEVPLFHDVRPYQVRIKVRECRPVLILDLLKIKDVSTVNWDGKSPFLGTGMTVIRSTSGAGIYVFDDLPDDFQATVYVGETLSSLTPVKIKFNKYKYGGDVDSFVVSDATSSYIVVLPSHSQNVSWTLKKQINAGDAPVQ